jgi:hypothetical protein
VIGTRSRKDLKHTTCHQRGDAPHQFPLALIRRPEDDIIGACILQTPQLQSHHTTCVISVGQLLHIQAATVSLLDKMSTSLRETQLDQHLASFAGGSRSGEREPHVPGHSDLPQRVTPRLYLQLHATVGALEDDIIGGYQVGQGLREQFICLEPAPLRPRSGRSRRVLPERWGPLDQP